MSVNSREDLNKYYQVINGLVDEYTEKWKIRPSNLKRYLQPGSERFNKFLERNGLNNDICKIVLRDVIDDRESMEKDGVLTFESYKVFESEEFKIHSLKSCLYKGIEKANLQYEKKLADYFDTDLSSIDIVDSEKHQFKINDWEGQDVKVIIYSDEDLDLIKSNISEHLLEELRKREVELTNNLTIKLSDLIDKNSFDRKIDMELNTDFLLKIIAEITEHDYKSKSGAYHIWFM